MDLGACPKHKLDVHRIELPPGVPKPPLLASFVAKRGPGKSSAAVRLAKHNMDHTPPVFNREQVWVISPTATSHSHLWEHLNLPPENIHEASTGAEVKAIMEDILEKIKEPRLSTISMVGTGKHTTSSSRERRPSLLLTSGSY